MTETRYITKDEAVAAVRAAAWTERSEEVTCGHPGCEDHRAEGRTVIHSYRGPFGADWDIDSVAAAIETAQRVAWVDHLMGHDLAVVEADGSTVFFAARHPERAR